MKRAKTIDEYLKGVSGEQRAALQKLRRQIKEAVPGLEEGMAWGMPSFKYKGKFAAGFAAFKNHLSFFPYGSTRKLIANKELAKYERTEGSVHFTPGKMLPAALVKKIVRAKIKLIEAGKARM